MAKPINLDAPLYDYISFFYELWKGNSPSHVSEPFSIITRALKDIYDENSDKGDFDTGLHQQVRIVLYNYRETAVKNIPFELEPFTDNLNVKRESTEKNFRAQWVVGWGKYRLNFDAAFTLAAIVSICRFRPRLIDTIRNKSNYEVYVPNNMELVTKKLLEKLYTFLPENLLSSDVKKAVMKTEDTLFRVLFYGTLYIIADSVTENSLNMHNEELAFKDRFVQCISDAADAHKIGEADYAAYFKALYDHTRFIRLSKEDITRQKMVEKTYVTPQIVSGDGNDVIRKGHINVIMGESGVGKTSLLYAMASASLYDKVADSNKSDEKFSAMRSGLQRFITLQLEDALPVYIYAKSYRPDANDIYPSVNRIAHGARSATSEGVDLETLMHSHNGPVLFLVDAIDEMGESDRSGFMSYLRRIRNTVPKSTFVITTRGINAGVFDDLSPEVNILKISYSDENIRQMIANYIKIFERRYKAEDFYRKINSNSYMKDILRNPYQIQKTVNTVKDIKFIHPVEVYDNLINGIIDDKWGGLFPKLKSNDIHNVLRSLACRVLSRGMDFIPDRRIADMLRDSAREAGVISGIDWKSFSESIAVRSGLLLYDDIRKGFSFMTENFARYLSAQWIYETYKKGYNIMLDRMEDSGIRSDSYFAKGVMADCLEKFKPEKETLIMLFFFADYMERGNVREGTSQVMMEMMLEKAIVYGDESCRQRMRQLLEEEIPASDMGVITLRNKRGYSLIEKL